MTTPSLDDAYDKLRWAGKQFQRFGPDIEALEKRNAHSIALNVNADTGEYVFNVHRLEVADPEWGLMIGDCLHNCRTALDYLMVRLYALVTRQDPREIDTVQFPVYDDPKRFNGAMGELRKLPTFSGYLTRIEELQPYNNGNPSIWGLGPGGTPRMDPLPAALDRLSRLDNIDKHRVIHAAWLAGAPFKAEVIRPPDGFEFIGGTASYEALKEGAEIGRWTFKTPLPFDWRPTEVDMKCYFPIQVAFDEALPFQGVREVLSLCMWAVEAVLSMFSPVFTENKPPKPVTFLG